MPLIVDDGPLFSNESDDPSPIPEELRCRRCRNPYSVLLACCPDCGASNLQFSGSRSAPRSANGQSDKGLITFCFSYAAVIVVDAIWGAALSTGIADSVEERLFALALIDLFFIIATVVAWWMTRSGNDLSAASPSFHPALPDETDCGDGVSDRLDEPRLEVDARQEEDRRHPLRAWLLAFPLLAVALGVNYGYHFVLSKLIGIESDESYVDLCGSLTAAVLFICVQPALFEEWYFRGIAWKVLRPHTSRWGTMLITSVMFAMAHLGVPVSVPALFIVGLMLGCVRLWSGGLLLPMILHFLHNLFVVLYP